MSGAAKPFRDHFNVIPLDDFLAVLRGSQPAAPMGALGAVPGPLGLVNPNEVSGNWGREAVIKYGATGADIQNGVLQQAPLIAIEGAGRRPVTMTIDGVIADAGATGTATYPAGADASGTPLGYRARLLISYGVSYGQVGFRTGNIAVDIGRRVTVAANILYVNAIALPPPAGYNAGSVNIGATVGVHGSPSLAPAVVTDYVDALGAGLSSAPIILPAKAGFLLPVQVSDIANLFTLAFQDQAGNPVTSIQVSAGQMVAPLPCSSIDYYAVIITNNSSSTASNYRLPWMLSL